MQVDVVFTLMASFAYPTSKSLIQTQSVLELSQFPAWSGCGSDFSLYVKLLPALSSLWVPLKSQKCAWHYCDWSRGGLVLACLIWLAIWVAPPWRISEPLVNQAVSYGWELLRYWVLKQLQIGCFSMQKVICQRVSLCNNKDFCKATRHQFIRSWLPCCCCRSCKTCWSDSLSSTGPCTIEYQHLRQDWRGGSMVKSACFWRGPRLDS